MWQLEDFKCHRWLVLCCYGRCCSRHSLSQEWSHYWTALFSTQSFPGVVSLLTLLFLSYINSRQPKGGEQQSQVLVLPDSSGLMTVVIDHA